MRNLRGMLTRVVLIAVVAASASTVVWFHAWQFPDPKEADRAGLLRWIVIRDLSEESPLVRGELARRFEEEFPAGLTLDSTSRRLDQSQIDRVRRNVSLLLEAWFLEQTDRYFALDRADRLSHVDAVIGTVEAWRQTVLLTAPGQNHGIQDHDTQNHPVQGSEETALWSVLLDETETWKRRADAEQRERISQFLGVVQARWFLRQFSAGSR